MGIEKINENNEKIFDYKALVIYTMSGLFILDNYINYRQYKRLKENRKLPKELESLNDKNYKESKEYNKEKLLFNFVKDLVVLIFEFLMFLYNFYPFIYRKSQEYCKFIPLFKFNPSNEYGPLFVFLIFDHIQELIFQTIFDIYKTFVLEEKYGFNKTTVKTFILDIIKTSILTIIFTPIILSLFVLIIEKTGKYFFIFGEILVVILVFIFLWVYPNFIQPLYNKFKELEDGELKKGIFNLANKINYPLQKVYIMDESQRSAHSNAYLYGLGKNKRIVLFDTLVQSTTQKEIEATLSHELGHWYYGHNIYTLIFSFIHFFFIFYVLKFFINNNSFYLSFGFQIKSIFIGIFMFLKLYTPIMNIIQLIENAIVRRFEYQADTYAVKNNYGEELKTCLIKLHKENKSDIDPDPLYSWVNNNHPTVLERIRNIEKISKDLKKDK